MAQRSHLVTRVVGTQHPTTRDSLPTSWSESIDSRNLAFIQPGTRTTFPITVTLAVFELCFGLLPSRGLLRSPFRRTGGSRASYFVGIEAIPTLSLQAGLS
jgi:hypothetical protein